MIKYVRAVVFALLVPLLSPAAARASVVVPLELPDLIAQAGAIVIGRVTDIESHWDAQGHQIYSTITLVVDEILRGGPAVATITLRQAGGTVGSLHAWTEGSPEFTVGERVLLFLGANADGSLRVLQMTQGKLSIVTDDVTGDDIAFQDPTPPGVQVLSQLGGGATMLPIARRLAELRQEIQGAGWSSVPSRPARLDAPAFTSAPAATEASTGFSFFDPPGRWFEPDNNQPVPFRVNSAGQSGAPTKGFEQFRAALAAWSSVSGSSLRLEDGGFTTIDQMAGEGVNVVMFGDKEGRMDPPVNCRGFLAIGGYFRYLQTKVINGTTFYRIIDGDVSIADGWSGCNFYENFANFSEVLTHELGHAIGFGHSSDPDATMNPIAHFDGRGAALKADDMAAVLFSYPASAAAPLVTLTVSVVGSGTVTSIPAGINCPGQCSLTLSKGAYVNLYPSGGTLAAWSGACSGSGNCQVVLTGNKTVTATFGAADLVVTAVSNPPAAVPPGGRFSATDTTANGGTVSAASSRTRYYLSLSSTWDDGDLLLSGTRSVSALAAGAAHTGSVTVTIPTTTALGTYYFLACADDLHAVAETSELNNCRAASGRVQVTRPDLVVTAMTILSSTASAGARVIVSDTTRNQGLVSAAGSTTRFYLSTDRTRSSTDKLMSGSRSVPGLGAGTDSVGTVQVTIPSSTVPGPYYIIACADDSARIIELDDGNNCLASALTLTVTP